MATFKKALLLGIDPELSNIPFRIPLKMTLCLFSFNLLICCYINRFYLYKILPL